MLLRAILILIVVIAISGALTMYFGQDVLVALGLILIQLQVIGKKLVSIELPSILAWLKTETAMFFRIELLKKWLMTTGMPLLLGKAMLNRVEAFLARYRDAISSQYRTMMDWYGGLDRPVQVVAALIVVFAALGLSVSSLGLWLILFSVKLPFWFVAFVTSTGRMIWLSARKMAFKAVAFLQLGWLWRFIRNRLPEAYLEKKRKFDFRVARAVVRRRRMTVRQVAERKDSFALWWAMQREAFRQRREGD